MARMYSGSREMGQKAGAGPGPSVERRPGMTKWEPWSVNSSERDLCSSRTCDPLETELWEPLCFLSHQSECVGGDWSVEHSAQSLAHNGASNGANSNQAAIVRSVFSAALSGSGLQCTMAWNKTRVEILRRKR